MKFKSLILTAFAAVLSCSQAFGQATILPPGETCFSALAPTSGGPGNTGTGFIGLLGTITPGAGGTNGTYGGVSLTGGSGSQATANITVSGGQVTQVAILNPGTQYVVGDVLSANPADIGNVTGFSVPVSSVSLNYALAGGSVGFYIPNTLTFKQTWQDSAESILNQNPVTLDANGCATIYGAGIYRMIVKDSLGNTVYDKLTASTGPSGLFWAGQAGGTGNAITVTDTSFALQDGASIQFLALAANTGSATLSVSGAPPILIVKDTSTGPQPLSGGEIGPGNTPIVTYDATNAEFHLVNPASTSGGSSGSASLTPPQGYLNLVGQASGDVVQTGDVVGAGTIFYSPFVGNVIPIWNGSSFVATTFSELTATLTSAGSPANSIQDECVFSNNGVPTLVTGPQWTNSAAGSGNRGTGAGSAQLTRQQGIWVNANQIIGYNGLSSFTIPANQCTYVGSVSIDATAGQVSAYRSYGQSRKFGVWNAYNRQPIIMLAGDPTSSWAYNIGTIRPSNNNTANSITTFTGLPEEQVKVTFNQKVIGGSASATSQVIADWQYGIGWNSTTSFSGQTASPGIRIDGSAVDILMQAMGTAEYEPTIGIGINTATSLELATSINNGSLTWDGSQTNMLLTASYRG